VVRLERTDLGNAEHRLAVPEDAEFEILVGVDARGVNDETGIAMGYLLRCSELASDLLDTDNDEIPRASAVRSRPRCWTIAVVAVVLRRGSASHLTKKASFGLVPWKAPCRNSDIM